jgi:HSP20 family protein
MPLRGDPLKELLELQERMNRLFEASLTRERTDEAVLLQAEWVPHADVLETADGFVLEIELPGLEAADVDIQVHGPDLTVRGVRQPKGARPEAFHRMERQHGPFSRTFRFPEDLAPDAVRAEFRDGLLRIEAPKKHPRGGVKVKIDTDTR